MSFLSRLAQHWLRLGSVITIASQVSMSASTLRTPLLGQVIPSSDAFERVRPTSEELLLPARMPAPSAASRRVRPSTSGTPDLVTLHVWLWYPTPAGLYNGTNPYVQLFNRG
jgi:hypothetical protein